MRKDIATDSELITDDKVIYTQAQENDFVKRQFACE